jgi:hypothetical protein
VAAADVDGKRGMHDDDAPWRNKAEQLLRVPERLTAYQKGYLYAVAKWEGVISLRHRIKVLGLSQKLHDAEERS